jgi:hypothetical protein
MTSVLTDTGGIATRSCPNCGGEILEKALQCSHCRKWLPEVMAVPAAAAPTLAAEPARLSRGQALRHFMLLTLFTGGLYELYWFYRNWRDLDESEASAEFAPRSALLTLGLLVPFVNVALVYRQLDRIRGAVSAAGLQPGYSPVLTTCIYFALGVLANMTMLWTISLLMVVPLLPVQDALNRYWIEREPDVPLREELNPRELAVIALGAASIVAALLLGWAMEAKP